MFFLWTILLFTTHQIDAMHVKSHASVISHRPSFHKGVLVNTTEDHKIILIMFDHHYLRLFDCFMRYFRNFSVQTPVDVVVYDQESELHVRGFQDKHKGVVRRLQTILPPYQQFLSSGRSDGSTNITSSYSSLFYQVHYWEVIQERLLKGEDVLHMDLDAIPVGDAWGPVAASDPNADIVAPEAYSYEHGPILGQQYVLYRSTKVVLKLIKHFASIWKQWFDKANASVLEEIEATNCRSQCRTGLGKPEAEQLALTHYLAKYNPSGNTWENCITLGACKVGDGEIIKVDGNLTSVVQNGICDYPHGCKREGYEVCHSRHIINHFCTADEIVGVSTA